MLAGFALLTLAVLRPTPSEVAHTTPAFQNIAADALLLMWATSRVSQALLSHPLHLFDAGIFYPARDTLAFGDHMIGQAIVGMPVWLTTHNPLLEYNLLVLLSYVVGATTMYALVREEHGHVAPALGAGVSFAFTPFRFNSPLWLQLLFTPFMPLAILFWLRFVRHLRARDWVLWVGCWAAHSLMGLYLMLYFSLTMGALGLLPLLGSPPGRRARLWAGTLAAPVAALVLLAPVLWPYVSLRTTQGHVRTSGLDTHLSFFLPGTGTWSGWLFGLDRGANAHFGPGLLVVALAAAGALAGWRAADPARRFRWRVQMTGLAVTTALVLVPLRVQFLVPGLDMVRNTDRAFLVGLLFVAWLVADGVAWLLGRIPSPGAAQACAVVLVLLLALDVGTPPHERKRMPVGAEVPPAYAWLGQLPAGEVVYEAANGPEALTRAMYFQIFHQKPLPIGYSGFTSPAGAYAIQRLAHFPEPEALVLLHELGVGHVLVHFARPAAAEQFLTMLAQPAVTVAARFGTDVVFAVRAPALGPVAPRVHPLSRDAWTLTSSNDPEQLDALRDGLDGTIWRTAPLAGQSAPWLRIDLGAVFPVAGVRCVLDRIDDAGATMPTMETSVDGEHWEATDARFRPDSLATFYAHPADVRFFEARFATRPARYVRLVNRDLAFWGGVWAMAELDVLTPDDPPTGPTADPGRAARRAARPDARSRS